MRNGILVRNSDTGLDETIYLSDAPRSISSFSTIKVKENNKPVKTKTIKEYINGIKKSNKNVLPWSNKVAFEYKGTYNFKVYEDGRWDETIAEYTEY